MRRAGALVAALAVMLGLFCLCWRGTGQQAPQQPQAVPVNTAPQTAEWQQVRQEMIEAAKSKPSKPKRKALRAKDNKRMNYTASGAGDSSYNGTYSPDGTYGGEVAYTNGSRWLWWYGYWVLSPNTGDVGFDIAYQNGATLPGTWTVGADGTSPAPTVAEYTPPPDPHYAIVIDTPVEDSQQPYGDITVTGRITGDPGGTFELYLTYDGDTSLVVSGDALAEWSFELGYPDHWSGAAECGLEARQVFDGDTAASDGVGFTWIGDLALDATANIATATAYGLEATHSKGTEAGLATAVASGLPATAELTLLEGTAELATATASGLDATGELKPDQNVTAGIASAVASGLDAGAMGVTTFERSHSNINWVMIRYKRGVD